MESIFKISKDKSTLMKGIVILMMINLHLFNKNNTDLCTNLLYIGDEPFAKWLTHACGPVWFFVLLSGYGLAYTYEKGGLGFVKQLKRIFKLYLHYWIILAVFLSIGSFLYADRFPGTWERLFVNVTGWETNYNYEMWFLFPYSLIALSSKYIIQAIEKAGYLIAIIITIIITLGASYVISRYHATILNDSQLLNWIMVYLQFLYPFTVGVAFCLAKWNSDLHIPTWVHIMVMIIAIIVVSSFSFPGNYIIYVPLMVFLFNQLSYPKWIERILIELGKKSMPMWMIHTWFCYYLFRDQVYSLKYPVVILVVLVLISYLLAIPFMWITKKVIARIKL